MATARQFTLAPTWDHRAHAAVSGSLGGSGTWSGPISAVLLGMHYPWGGGTYTAVDGYWDTAHIVSHANWTNLTGSSKQLTMTWTLPDIPPQQFILAWQGSTSLNTANIFYIAGAYADRLSGQLTTKTWADPPTSTQGYLQLDSRPTVVVSAINDAPVRTIPLYERDVNGDVILLAHPTPSSSEAGSVCRAGDTLTLNLNMVSLSAQAGRKLNFWRDHGVHLLLNEGASPSGRAYTNTAGEFTAIDTAYFTLAGSRGQELFPGMSVVITNAGTANGTHRVQTVTEVGGNTRIYTQANIDATVPGAGNWTMTLSEADGYYGTNPMVVVVEEFDVPLWQYGKRASNTCSVVFRIVKTTIEV